MRKIQFKQDVDEEQKFEITNLERLNGASVYVECALTFLKEFDKNIHCDISTFEWVESLKKTLHRVKDDLGLILEDQKMLYFREPWETEPLYPKKKRR